MPWSNQGGGGGKGGKGGPWGGGGGGGGGPWGGGGGSGGGGGGSGQPPDLEEMLKRSQDRVKQVMHGGGVPGPLLVLISAIGAALLGWYAFTFRVNPDEVGVVLRFGEYVKQVEPGLHPRLPPPIDTVLTPKVTVRQRTDIAPASRRSGQGDGMLMLTGDGNVVDVRSVVLWHIKTELDKQTGEPGVRQFLFNIQDPALTVREVGESVVREVVGQSDLQSIMTEGRVMAQDKAQKLVQQILDSYRAGIAVDSVQFIEVDAPSDVVAAFRDVQAASQDKQRLVKEAQTYADQIVPRAKGEADRIVATAEGYKNQTVAEATGQAARFLKVYEEYKKAPEVTRQRLFLEMQERVLQGADKVIIDGKAAGGVVPYLPLDQLTKKKSEGGN